MDRRDAGGKSWSSIGERFLRLALVGVLLSHWSTRGFLEMDEVMLSALLFLGCVVLSRFDWRILMVLILMINTSYLLLMERDLTGVFYNYYLGGYPAALYYLPVMLAGLLVGRNIISREQNILSQGQGEVLSRENGVIVLLVAVMFVVSWSYTSVEKLKATPSFMMLAILLCFLIFAGMDRLVRSLGVPGELEYLGRKPFRYWIMMYVLFIIPLKEWAGYTSTRLPLDLSWTIAVLSSFCLLIILWMISKLLDAMEHTVMGAGNDR